jgi:hypothetical protein
MTVGQQIAAALAAEFALPDAGQATVISVKRVAPRVARRHGAHIVNPSLAIGLAIRASLAAALLAACQPRHDLPRPDGAHLVEHPALSEMSGLEASPSTSGHYWTVNDSGSRSRLYRIGADGSDLGHVALRGAQLEDAETLAVWDAPHGTWLLVGDVGDNRGRRDEVVIHALLEPKPGQAQARVAWQVRYTYPDGARDAEGMAVDHAHGRMLVLTKRDRPQRLYGVALPNVPASLRTEARLLGELPAHVLDAEATGLDLSRDGRRLAVLTYRSLYLWVRRDGEAWTTTLQRAPAVLPFPQLRKAEAMAFSSDERYVLVGSEQRPAYLLHIPLPEALGGHVGHGAGPAARPGPFTRGSATSP